MKKKYLAKIIAKDYQGLQLISAICAKGIVKNSGIKYLPKSKIFLLYLEKIDGEKNKLNTRSNSICKFEFVDSARSKNIDQTNNELELKLIAIDILKNKLNYEINLIFSDKAYITLSTEIIEVTLENQN